MNLAHLHMLLNHVPTVGTAIAIALLVIAFIRKSDELRRVSLEAFFIIALATLPAYLSGVAAQAEISERPDVSNVLIEAHEDAAAQSFILMQLTGGFAWLALWQIRRIGRPGRGSMGAVVLLAAVTMAITARAANLGGEIRHPEIVADPAAAEAAAALATDPNLVTANALGRMMTDVTWLWPASEALHFIGMWLLFGVILLVNLRMLGMLRSIPFAALHRLLPWAALGFAINTITGMLFVTSTPDQYALNISFHWKIAMLMIAGVNLLYATAFEGPWWVGAGQDAPARAKAMAASSIIYCVVVMYFVLMLLLLL
jgi:uncharacterized membrane protein